MDNRKKATRDCLGTSTSKYVEFRPDKPTNKEKATRPEFHPPQPGPGALGGRSLYKVDTEAIALKVKQEYAAKEKA